MQTAQIQIDEQQYRDVRDARTLYYPEQMFERNVEVLVAGKLATYDDADLFRKEIPSRVFLWIPPRPREMNYGNLMSLVKTDGKPGVNYIGREPCWDTVKVPAGPYFALNVRDGSERLGMSSANSRADIISEHRSPATLFEGIIHSMLYPIVLASHGMNICGSDCESERILNLSLGRGEVLLRAMLFDSDNPHFGVPSCGKRLAS